METLVLKLEVQARRIELEGKDGGSFEIREMDSATRDKYLDLLSARAKVTDKGEVVGIKKMDGMHAELLTRCMYKIDDIDHTKETRVPVEQIQAWPSSVVTQLYRMAQELSHLNTKQKDGETESKKGSEANV